PQWFNLAHLAAKVRIAFIKSITINFILPFNGQFCMLFDDIETVMGAHSFFQLLGFGKVKSGIEIDDWRFRRDKDQLLNQDDSLGAKMGIHAKRWGKSSGSPL